MYKIILIGGGRIFDKHLNAIKNLASVLKLVGIVESDREKHPKLREKIDCAIYTDVEAAIAITKPDIAVILTDSGSHFSIAKLICGHVAHVLVEKPMTLNLRAALELVKLYDSSNSSLSVVKQNRYNDAIELMKECTEHTDFGRANISSVKLRWCRTQDYYDQSNWRGKWATDGGVIANQAIHHIDLQQWLMGEFESVFAYSSTYGSKIDVEDTLVATIKFKSGAIGTIEATTAARPSNIEASISVLGSQASIQVGGFAANKIDYCTLPVFQEKCLDVSEHPIDVYGNGHVKMYKDFVKALEYNTKYPIGGREAIKSIKLINALYKSIELQREVWASEDCSSERLGWNGFTWQ